MVHEAAKARAKHASMENPPTSAALAALIWEHEQAARFAAKMEGSGRGDRQQQGSPSDLQHRGEKSNATKEALIAAMLQQQSLMKGRGPSPPPGAMRGFGAASDIKHARGGVAGSYGKISPSSSRGDVEAPSVRHPGRHDSPGTNSEAGMSETKTSMQQLMQQHAAAQYWASRGGPDSGRRSPSSASALHGHSREDIDRIYR